PRCLNRRFGLWRPDLWSCLDRRRGHCRKLGDLGPLPDRVEQYIISTCNGQLLLDFGCECKCCASCIYRFGQYLVAVSERDLFRTEGDQNVGKGELAALSANFHPER